MISDSAILKTVRLEFELLCLTNLWIFAAINLKSGAIFTQNVYTNPACAKERNITMYFPTFIEGQHIRLEISIEIFLRTKVINRLVILSFNDTRNDDLSIL